jgi:hypothetical protein
MAKMAGDRVIEWLLAGDAAIRFQTLRDLAGSSERAWKREQRCVASTGWGARLLALQDADGRWGGGIYTPKWTSTTYTLLLLRDLGLAPGNAQALRACRLLLDEGFWSDGGINFYPRWAKCSETCITAMALAVSRWFGLDDPRIALLAEHLLAAQMPDGGWNCRATPGYGGATHGSFHTTISALEALLGWPDATQARARGEEFLLVHRLFRSHRTGAIAKADFTRFHFPPRWHYDVLRALDYFRAADATQDPRLQDAIELVHARRQSDGMWPFAKGYPGKVFFELEKAGEASRWNTLRALRVLRWSGHLAANAPRNHTVLKKSAILA